MKHDKITSDLSLRLGTVKDAQVLYSLKFQAFLPLYKKYQDDKTSPVKEPLEKIIAQIQQENTDYYIIEWNLKAIGGVRIKHLDEKICYLSPIYLLPEYQNQGIGRKVILEIFKIYSSVFIWRLDTIEQETKNCRFYESLGFTATGKKNKINERMTLIDYERIVLDVRLFEKKDAEGIAQLLKRNFLEVNSKDYGMSAALELVKTHDAAWVQKTAEYATIYVFWKDDEIVACGAISSFWGSLEESILLLVFVSPEYHGLGIGRKIIQTLEQDELFLRAKRVEIPASITACEFYRKFGYDWKDGKKELDGEGHYRLEKFKTAGERI